MCNMDTKTESKSSTKELESLLSEEITIAGEASKVELSVISSYEDGNIQCTDNDADHSDLNEEENNSRPLNTEDIIVIRIWRNNYVYISKPMMPLRIAQFLWFGGSRMVLYFFSVILKQRGMTLVDLSFAFSFTFLFQLISSIISGVVADKIGNAKPILLFHMIATLAVIMCVLFGPNIRDNSCFEHESHLTSSRICSCDDNSVENNTEFSFSETYIYTFVNSNGSNASQTSLRNKEYFMNYTEIPTENVTDNCSTPCSSNLKNGCFSRRKGFVAYYTIVIFSLFAFWTNGYRFLDFIAATLAARNGSNFGKERFVAMVGEFTISAISAFILNVKSPSEGAINYDIAYWCSFVAIFLSFISVCHIQSVLPPGRNLTKKAFGLVKNVDAMVFLFVVFVGGNGYGINTQFHLWILESLKASKTIIGLHSMMRSFYGVLVLLTAKWWVKKLGTGKIFVLGLTSYFFNEIGYSFLQNPWFSLILEITVVFTYHLFWVSAVLQSRSLAPEGLGATLNAVAGNMHFGIGRSTAVLGGGLLMNYFGAKTAYRIFGTLCLTTALFYSIYLYRRSRSLPKTSTINGKELEVKTSRSHESHQDV